MRLFLIVTSSSSVTGVSRIFLISSSTSELHRPRSALRLEGRAEASGVVHAEADAAARGVGEPLVRAHRLGDPRGEAAAAEDLVHHFERVDVGGVALHAGQADRDAALVHVLLDAIDAGRGAGLIAAGIGGTGAFGDGQFANAASSFLTISARVNEPETAAIMLAGVVVRPVERLQVVAGDRPSPTPRS